MNVKLYLGMGILLLLLLGGCYILGHRDCKMAAAETRNLEIAAGIQKKNEITKKVSGIVGTAADSDIEQWLLSNRRRAD